MITLPFPRRSRRLSAHSRSKSINLASLGPFATSSHPRRRRLRRNTLLLFLICAFTIAAGYVNSSIDKAGRGTDLRVGVFRTFIEPISRFSVVRSRSWPTLRDVGEGSFSPAGKSYFHRQVDGEDSLRVYPNPDPKPKPALGGKHAYNPNGLLQVNPRGLHPIYELIARAEKEWEDKLARASRTLKEAVVEYERRYGRKPPRGFDKWWAYIKKHNVQLPDEYDQIHTDLEPFWGVPPTELQSVQREHEVVDHIESFTIGKLTLSDPIVLLNRSAIYTEAFARHDVATMGHMIMKMLREAGVEGDIPPFRATFNPHDGPMVVRDWELSSRAVEVVAHSMLPPGPQKPPSWLHSCPPTSPARTNPLPHLDESSFDSQKPLSGTSQQYLLRPSLDPLSPTSSRTFIHDHKLSMDPCLHPHLFRQHGQFLKYVREDREGPVPQTYLVPLFSISPSVVSGDVRAAVPFEWVDEVPGVRPVEGADADADQARIQGWEWSQKTDERLLWRGSNTGIVYSNKYQWWASHRTRLMEWAQGGWDRDMRVIVTPVPSEEVGQGTLVHKSRWAPAMLDVAFSGRPVECSEGEGVCGVLKQMFEWRRGVAKGVGKGRESEGGFKWILDIDGNAWSSRFKRLITTGSCIFKATIYPEWYTDRIQPWLHYVPVQIDLSDLWDTFVFFRGDLNGEGGHDELGRRIGERGREWSRGFWRVEDMVAYDFRLFLEYARVMSGDRDEMGYVYREEDEVD